MSFYIASMLGIGILIACVLIIYTKLEEYTKERKTSLEEQIKRKNAKNGTEIIEGSVNDSIQHVLNLFKTLLLTIIFLTGIFSLFIAKNVLIINGVTGRLINLMTGIENTVILLLAPFLIISMIGIIIFGAIKILGYMASNA